MKFDLSHAETGALLHPQQAVTEHRLTISNSKLAEVPPPAIGLGYTERDSDATKLSMVQAAAVRYYLKLQGLRPGYSLHHQQHRRHTP